MKPRRASPLSASRVNAPQTVVHYGDAGAALRLGRFESALSIALSESSSSLTAWRIKVEAITNGGRARLGSIITAAPSAIRQGGRVVAIASCPGALAWDVTVRPVPPYPADAAALLHLSACDDSNAGPGLMPCDGALAVAGDSEAGAYNHDAGTAAGVTTIPVGARVRGWSLEASGGGAATVIITSPIFGALPVITVPTNGSFGDTPEGLIGPATFTFGGFVATRWVSWRELQ